MTAGTLDADSVGRAADDLGTTANDGWTAPAASGSVNMWIVLRDARGGIGWASYDIAVSSQ